MTVYQDSREGSQLDPTYAHPEEDNWLSVNVARSAL
jgi:hypothetical protein